MSNIEELLQVIKTEVEAREMTEGIRISEVKRLENFQERVHCPQRLPLLLERVTHMIEDVFIARLTITQLVARK